MARSSGASSNAAGAKEVCDCASFASCELAPRTACCAARSSCAFFRASCIRLMASSLSAVQFLDPDDQGAQLDLKDSEAAIALEELISRWASAQPLERRLKALRQVEIPLQLLPPFLFERTYAVQQTN